MPCAVLCCADRTARAKAKSSTSTSRSLRTGGLKLATSRCVLTASMLHHCSALTGTTRSHKHSGVVAQANGQLSVLIRQLGAFLRTIAESGHKAQGSGKVLPDRHPMDYHFAIVSVLKKCVQLLLCCCCWRWFTTPTPVCRRYFLDEHLKMEVNIATSITRALISQLSTPFVQPSKTSTKVIRLTVANLPPTPVKRDPDYGFAPMRRRSGSGDEFGTGSRSSSFDAGSVGSFDGTSVFESVAAFAVSLPSAPADDPGLINHSASGSSGTGVPHTPTRVIGPVQVLKPVEVTFTPPVPPPRQKPSDGVTAMSMDAFMTAKPTTAAPQPVDTASSTPSSSSTTSSSSAAASQQKQMITSGVQSAGETVGINAANPQLTGDATNPDLVSSSLDGHAPVVSVVPPSVQALGAAKLAQPASTIGAISSESGSGAASAALSGAGTVNGAHAQVEVDRSKVAAVVFAVQFSLLELLEDLSSTSLAWERLGNTASTAAGPQ